MRTRLLDLPRGFVTMIDESDWGSVRHLTLYRGSNGYVYYSTWENGRSVPRTLHSFLMGRHEGMHIDHINGDKLDNRRENLRVVTPSANQANRRKLNRNNSSGVRGVHFDKCTQKWLAQITFERKNRYLGVFGSLEEAVAVRKAAERELFGSECP